MEPGASSPRHPATNADAAGSTPPAENSDGTTIARTAAGEATEERSTSPIGNSDASDSGSDDDEVFHDAVNGTATSSPAASLSALTELPTTRDAHTSGADGRPDTSTNAETEDKQPTNTSPPPTSPPSPPPFWTPRTTHNRTISYHSITHPSHPTIALEDHSAETSTQTQSCWAESATIDTYVVVSGPTGIGAYVVWHCTVRTLGGGDLEVRKRYSEFVVLRENLVASFPNSEAMIPELPRKSVVSRLRPKFLEARRRGLQHFLNFVLLNPEFASSPVLKEFVFT